MVTMMRTLFILLVSLSISDISCAGFEQARQEMVTKQLAARGITDTRVLSAMAKVPRHEFVLEELQEEAYIDSPLPIGYRQTISQPYIVAFMTQALAPKAEDKILEIGTGSGYQAAVLAELVAEVYTIEIVHELAVSATERLKRLTYKNIQVRSGDGYLGWQEAAPFDAIMVTAGADHIPQPLIDQLKSGGKLIMPVGSRLFQDLQILRKDDNGKVRVEKVLPVRFVPLTRKTAN